jgi:hypothetical protein
MACMAASSQEYLQQPTTINLYRLDYLGNVLWYNDIYDITYNADGRLNSILISDTSPYIELYDKHYEYDEHGRLIHKYYDAQVASSWWGNDYYWTYDNYSNLTEYTVFEHNKYISSRLLSKDEYYYKNNDLETTKYYEYNPQTYVFEYQYSLNYSYSSDGLTKTEVKINADDFVVGRKTYEYADSGFILSYIEEVVDSTLALENLYKIDYEYANNHLTSKRTLSWSRINNNWNDSICIEYQYDNDKLTDIYTTNWMEGIISSRFMEHHAYDEYGNCILILYQTLVDEEFCDTQRILYTYDENNLCISALKQKKVENTWDNCQFSPTEYLLFGNNYYNLNTELGSLTQFYRAEILSYTTTVNPYNGSNDVVYESQCKIYPNPGNGVMMISNDIEKVVVKIMDINGRLIKTQQIGVGTSSVTMDDQPSGLYIWHIWKDGKNVSSGKWIKY